MECDFVVDYLSNQSLVFSASGQLELTMGRSDFTGVAVHGSTVIAQDRSHSRCVVFE